jgi:hypothetical protein
MGEMYKREDGGNPYVPMAFQPTGKFDKETNL